MLSRSCCRPGTRWAPWPGSQRGATRSFGKIKICILNERLAQPLRLLPLVPVTGSSPPELQAERDRLYAQLSRVGDFLRRSASENWRKRGKPG